MKKPQSVLGNFGFLAFLGCLFLAVIISFFYGYVHNIFAIIDWNESTGKEIVRIIGVFLLPLGALLGYF